MEKIPVLTKTQLIDANNWAIEIGYNRALDPEPLQNYLDGLGKEVKFPIVLSLPHHHAAGKEVEEHVRCKIVLDGEGSNAMIDIDFDLFNSLETVELE
jgi:hypothetical protein